MDTLFSKEALDKSIERIQKIQPNQQPLWGKMNSSQMLDHCSETMKVARGQKQLNRMFLSYIMGSLMKKSFYNDKPVPKNSPTHKSFIITPTSEFEKSKKELIDHLVAFQEGGPEKCTDAPHTFFGKLTKEQWGMGMYKHLDHHLQQFGV
ncbi:DUF1569 domain-containing protein [Fluviicola sp.]|jgi:hypothetical protein|uniref:DUF1569 domain-containing protein n=1 Tax=Fluviicola sp. TaxID=1917219 RepID=UPI002820A25A|nr:DUF1569 domain-containing protein [Fluviicola sp.]MDR0800975.1 DUF1569 domain-containing protein [Fluviicola sp.]